MFIKTLDAHRKRQLPEASSVFCVASELLMAQPPKRERYSAADICKTAEATHHKHYNAASNYEHWASCHP